MKRYLWTTIAIAAFLVIFFGGALVTLYTDGLWFADLGYYSIFSKMLWTRIGLTAVFGAIFFVIVYSNLLIARRMAPPTRSRFNGIDIDLRDRLSTMARRGLGLLLMFGTLVVSIIVGLQAASNWDVWLKFVHGSLFNVKDPILGMDVGFYIFKLPFWTFLYNWFFFALIVATIAAAVIHYTNEGIDVLGNSPRFAPGVKTHLAILIAMMFFLKAVGYRLGMYSLVQTPGDLFYGAGYSDVHARLPALWILLVAAVIGGLLVLYGINRRGIWHAAGALLGLIGLSIIVGAGYPAAVDQFVVKPSALQKQRPYILNAVKFTRMAFNIDEKTITSREFPYVPNLTQDEIVKNKAAVQNLRLWDYEPLKRTYQQLQELQQYYTFNDVDIDRYTIDGTYRQVMLSARELAGGPAGSNSWINEHLRYTHGYSFAMSPVNEVTQEGLPVFFASGIPTVTRGGITLDVPQIYFGEATNGYVLVNTGQKEFDYPGPAGDVETTYTADSGPRVGGFFRRLALATRFGDAYILISSEIKPSSRILFRRDIIDRAQTLFPFLTFDKDPYLVNVNGGLYWIHDAYTTSDQYPYSEPDDDMGVNYVRNSVKVITNAYTGKVAAYISDPNDPIVKTWSSIFPGTLKPMDSMPVNFRQHVRYPEDLFKIQAKVYSKYHMTNPDTFYSGTDMWRLPMIPGEDGSENDRELEPYYVITRLPNSTNDEFILIAPLIRAEKENMVAWMAAKCDPADYGRLVVYQFPSGKLVFGPSQIMSRANQDTQISQQLTLWNQLGSSVVRGRLLAIPIENSILYVEPLYLQSTTTKMPEFKRVIVALGNNISMQPTLEEAVAQVANVQNIPITATSIQPPGPTGGQPGAPTTAPATPQPVVPTAPPDVQALTKRAVDQFNRAQDAQRKGDWAAYGKELDSLKRTLNELNQKTGR